MAHEQASAVHHAVHGVDVNDHVAQDLEVLLLVLEGGEAALDQQASRVGDDPLGHFGRPHFPLEGPRNRRRPGGAVGDLPVELLEEIRERQPTLTDAPEERRRDDETVDLIRALEDPVDARVPVVALDGIVSGEPVAPQDLQRFVSHEVERLRAEDLQDRRLDRVFLDRVADQALGRIGRVRVDAFGGGVHQARRPVAHAVGHVDAGRHVGELPLDHAEARDRTTELPPLLGVGEGHVETVLRGADGSGTELEPPDVQDVEGNLVPLADLSQDGVRPHRCILEDQLSRR